ncbi:hypothetical protein V1264_005627 [Littorina saxatilis]|uniref:Uncharacterized protein n=2 Tax=Littorina saxatilis TaxID=31220 RepID=A0AAN9AZK2_9CAEN
MPTVLEKTEPTVPETTPTLLPETTTQAPQPQTAADTLSAVDTLSAAAAGSLKIDDILINLAVEQILRQMRNSVGDKALLFSEANRIPQSAALDASLQSVAGKVEQSAPASISAQENQPALGMSSDQEIQPAPGMSSGQEIQPAPGMSSGQEIQPAPGMSSGQEIQPAPGMSSGQEIQPAPGTSGGQWENQPALASSGVQASSPSTTSPLLSGFNSEWVGAEVPGAMVDPASTGAGQSASPSVNAAVTTPAPAGGPVQDVASQTIPQTEQLAATQTTATSFEATRDEVLQSIANLLRLHPELLEQLRPSPPSVLTQGSQSLAAGQGSAFNSAQTSSPGGLDTGNTSPSAGQAVASDPNAPAASSTGMESTPASSGLQGSTSLPAANTQTASFQFSLDLPSSANSSAPVQPDGTFQPAAASSASPSSASVDLALAGPNGPGGSVATAPVASTIAPNFDVMTAMQDPFFAHLMEAHIHQLMTQTNHLQHPNATAAPWTPGTFDLNASMQDPSFVALLDGHLHTLMKEGKALFSPPAAVTTSATTTASPGVGMASTVSGVIKTDLPVSNAMNMVTSTPAAPAAAAAPTFSLAEAMKDPNFVTMMESYINNVIMQNQQQTSTNISSATTPSIPSATTPSILSASTLAPVANTTAVPAPPSTTDLTALFNMIPNGTLTQADRSTILSMLTSTFQPKRNPASPSLPAVSQATFHNMEEVYYILRYLRPTQPTVLGQIKYLLQVNPPRGVLPNPATFTQVNTPQLLKLGVPVTNQQETNVVGTSINVLARVYGLTVEQTLKLLSGAHPGSLVRVVTTPKPAPTGTGTPLTKTGTATPLNATGTPLKGTGTPLTSTNAAATITPTGATTVAPMMLITAEPTEAPEPGDPGFIEHFFRLGGNITAEHLIVLQEMAMV